MSTLVKVTRACVVAAVAGLLLAGCTGPAIFEALVPGAGSVVPAGSPDGTESNKGAGLNEGTEPNDGTKIVDASAIIRNGRWGAYDFYGQNGERAILEARVVNIQPLGTDEAEAVRAVLSELEGYALAYITVEQRKISGDSIKFQFDATRFKPVTASGGHTHDLGFYVWAGCPTETFSGDFDDGLSPLSQCVLSATAPGAEPVGGVRYVGSHHDLDNPYDDHTGNPILFLLD